MTRRSARVVPLGIALLLTVQFTPAASAVDPLPVAMNARTGDLYATIQAALDAAGPGDAVTVVMNASTPAVAYTEGLVIAQDGVTLCATVALGTCAPVSAPGRWQNSATTWGSPPVALQGEALKAGASGSTSFYATSQDPTATPLAVSGIEHLSFAFLLATGSCTGGGLRFQLRLDSNGDDVADKTLFAYPKPSFACPLGKWVPVDIMDGGTWGLDQVGGPSTGGTKAQADALTAGMDVLTINLIFDAAPAGSEAWFDNERVNDAVFREQVDMACLDASSPACITTSARSATILDSPAGATSTVKIAGEGVTLEGFTIRATGSGNAQNVLLVGDGASILDNVIEGNTLSDVQFGVLADSTGAAPWLIANNTITRAGHTGIYVSGQAPGKIADNLVTQNRDNAIYTEGSTGLLTIERNDLRQALQANLRVTGSRPMVLRDNALGVSEYTIDFLASDAQVTDARYNDWGAYSREDIEATINNLAGRALDISCYFDASAAPICPPTASFTLSTSSPHFGDDVVFTDASSAGGNDIASRAWDFGDGTTSTAVSPTHAFATSGVKTVTLTLTDSEGFQDVETATVTVGNTAPVLTVPTPPAGTEGVAMTFTLGATDADGDVLSYSGLGLPAGASVNPASGAFSWTPSYTQAGAHEVTFRATDGELSSTQTVVLEVANVDRAPSMAPFVNRTVAELATLNVTILAIDPDGDAVVISASGLPTWATLTQGSLGRAWIAGTPSVGELGTSNVTVTATAGSLSVSRMFVITVVPSAGLQLAVVGLPVVHTSPGEAVTLNATIKNTGPQTDTFTLALSNTRGWTLSGPASVTLAPGESATVSATLVAPARSEKTTVSLKATSTLSPAVSKSVSWNVDTPVTLAFEVVGSPTVLDGAKVKASATWLDGSAAANLTLRATQAPFIGQSSQLTGKTDASGELVFEFTDTYAKLPGPHDVTIVLVGPLTAQVSGSYDVGVA